ncbi:MAG: hypothetical protein E6R03_14335 [Hyphomicrobiaceae bacterium]|nr:MAG: hypothetical protein E6R03_14335 [Hyphomicrobiaceae bacterium]
MKTDEKAIKLTASQVRCLEALKENRFQFPGPGFPQASLARLEILGLADGDLRPYAKNFNTGRLECRRAYCRTPAGTKYLEGM